MSLCSAREKRSPVTLTTESSITLLIEIIMEGFIGFVCIIFGILNIILFFKVWNMCNDVKRIADHFCGTDYKPKYNFSSIDLADGKDARKAMIAELKEVAMKSRGIYTEDYESQYGVNPNTEITNIIKKYKGIFDSLDEKFPKDLESIKTLEDLWEKFD